MSKLYATIDSDARKTKATSRGHKSIITHTACWDGAIRVEMWQAVDGSIQYRVSRVVWEGNGAEKAADIAAGVM